jgi:hypothetical protein
MRILKTSNKAHSHEEYRKCKSIHFWSPTFKHHKYLVVANFDCNAVKLVQAIIKIICSPPARRLISVSVRSELQNSGVDLSYLIKPWGRDRVGIAFDWRMANDSATIKGRTNENNTDVDRWADACGLRINGKPRSKPWRCPNVPTVRLAGSR